MYVCVVLLGGYVVNKVNLNKIFWFWWLFVVFVVLWWFGIVFLMNFFFLFLSCIVDVILCDLGNGILVEYLIVSLLNMVFGLFFVIVIGVMLGFVIGENCLICELMGLFLSFVCVILLVVIVLIVIVVMGMGFVLKVFIIVFVCVWLILFNIVDGVCGMNL